MTKAEIIKAADNMLKNIPAMRKGIKELGNDIKYNGHTVKEIEELKKKRGILRINLLIILAAIRSLDEERQRIINYKYFQDLSYNAIGYIIGMSRRTIARRIQRSKLTIGQILFGFEDEFVVK